MNLEKYWNDIPIGRENAISYSKLMKKWHISERRVRNILHQLSGWDNGDKYILIRSSHNKGFYKTKDKADIESYKRECTSRARKTFIPLKKINRILNINTHQISLFDYLELMED